MFCQELSSLHQWGTFGRDIGLEAGLLNGNARILVIELNINSTQMLAKQQHSMNMSRDKTKPTK